MAQTSGFFNAVRQADNTLDRVYSAELFAAYFARFIGNGVFGGALGGMQVVEESGQSNVLSVAVNSGQAWINGYWYESDELAITRLEDADTTQDRIDSIVVRLDFVERSIRLVYLKGTPDSNPVPPTLQRNPTLHWDLRLANVLVEANATLITQLEIFDTRMDSNDCGFVHGVVDQLDTTGYGSRLNGFIDQFIQDAQDEYNNVFLATLGTLRTNADDYYNNTFLPTLQGLETDASDYYSQTFLPTLSNLETLADEAYNDFLSYIAGLKTDTQTQLQAMLDELQQLVESDTFGELIARIDGIDTRLDGVDTTTSQLSGRITTLEGLQPMDSIGNILHELNEYPLVVAYEYTDPGDGSVSIDNLGVVTGAVLTSTPVKWKVEDTNNVEIFTRVGIGTVGSITMITNRIYTVSYSDSATKLYIRLGGTGGGSGGGGGGACSPMFSVYYSQSDREEDNINGVKGWTGEFVANGATQFPEFYEALKSNSQLLTTRSDYQARITANGSCSLYTVDVDMNGDPLPGAIRFPMLTNYIRGPRQGEDGRTELGDAIRNIMGEVSGGGGYSLVRDNNGTFSGVFSGVTRGTSILNGGSAPGGQDVTFNASRVVPTSSENRPKTQILYPWIVVSSHVEEVTRRVEVADEGFMLDLLNQKISKPNNGAINSGILWWDSANQTTRVGEVDGVKGPNDWIYSVYINYSSTTPGGASLVYGDDNSGFNPASGNTLNSWAATNLFSQDWTNENAFIRPCVMSANDVKPKYYLRPNNYTLKADGTASVLNGVDGDVYVEIKPIWYKIEAGANSSIFSGAVFQKVTLASYRVDSSFRCTHDIGRGVMANRMYMGCFLCVPTSYRSISGVAPQGNQTYQAFQTGIKNGESGLYASNNHMGNYFLNGLYKMFYLLLYRSRDTGPNVGLGNGNTAITNVNGSQGANIAFNQQQGNWLRFLGCEAMWGVSREFLDGCIIMNGFALTTRDVNLYNALGTNYENIISITNIASLNYIATMQMGTDIMMVTDSVAGSVGSFGVAAAMLAAPAAGSRNVYIHGIGQPTTNGIFTHGTNNGAAIASCGARKCTYR